MEKKAEAEANCRKSSADQWSTRASLARPYRKQFTNTSLQTSLQTRGRKKIRVSLIFSSQDRPSSQSLFFVLPLRRHK